MLVLKRFYSKWIPSTNLTNKTVKNLGIKHQQKIIGKPESELDASDFDELESDFMEVHKSHKEHIKELEAWREKEKYLIVRQKYFKEKYPSFLTWQDREQIKFLHNTDPEEWNIERLSEGFPALPDVIEKIVKSKWSKNSQSKINSYNQKVVQNWQDFKQGKLNNLPTQLKAHLAKFSNRKVNLQQSPTEIALQSDLKKTEVKGEFSEIISSYQKLKGQNETIDNLDGNKIEYFTDQKPKNVKKDRSLVTFSELKQSLEQKLSKGNAISAQEKLIKDAKLSQTIEENSIEIKEADLHSIVKDKHKTNQDEVGFVKKTSKDMSHLIYPERIVIPEQIYKKGYTYKLNDCYYASDGEFLYRVPGMS